MDVIFASVAAGMLIAGAPLACGWWLDRRRRPAVDWIEDSPDQITHRLGTLDGVA